MSGKFWDSSLNVVRGCSAQRDGACRARCWASRLASTRLAHLPQYAGLTRDGRWTGEVRFDPEELDRPLRWKKPRTILVSLMGDWLDPGVSDGHAQSILDCARLFRRHTFLTVTKRAARLPVLLAEERPLPNILHGVSVCDQADADERLPHLFTLKAQGWRVWAIAEPLLGPIVLAPNLTHRVAHDDGGTLRVSEQCPSLDWLVVGKENHAGARPCDPVWIKSIVRQCREAKVPCFVKGGLPEADPDFVQQRPEETPA